MPSCRVVLGNTSHAVLGYGIIAFDHRHYHQNVVPQRTMIILSMHRNTSGIITIGDRSFNWWKLRIRKIKYIFVSRVSIREPGERSHVDNCKYLYPGSKCEVWYGPRRILWYIQFRQLGWLEVFFLQWRIKWWNKEIQSSVEVNIRYTKALILK